MLFHQLCGQGAELKAWPPLIRSIDEKLMLRIFEGIDQLRDSQLRHTFGGFAFRLVPRLIISLLSKRGVQLPCVKPR